jgi:hypothetical protein
VLLCLTGAIHETAHHPQLQQSPHAVRFAAPLTQAEDIWHDFQSIMTARKPAQSEKMLHSIFNTCTMSSLGRAESYNAAEYAIHHD